MRRVHGILRAHHSIHVAMESDVDPKPAPTGVIHESSVVILAGDGQGAVQCAAAVAVAIGTDHDNPITTMDDSA